MQTEQISVRRGAIRTMFGFTCVPSHKPNKFRLSGVLSEQCFDLLAACDVSAFMFGLHVLFDALPRLTARALIRTSLGLLERSDTSEKPPPNPNFVRFAGAIRHFV